MSEEKHVHEQIMEEFQLSEEGLIRKSLLLLYFMYEKQQEGNRIYVYVPGENEEEGGEPDGVAKVADVNAFLAMPFENEQTEESTETNDEPVVA